MIAEFGTAAILIAPSSPLLSSGYVPGNPLGAQHMNYYLNHLTAELNNVLTAAGISQSAADDTQVSKSVEILAGSGAVISTSGTLGTISPVPGTLYVLTGASTATLPASPQKGCRLTFKAKTNATSTISANSGQTIGTTTSTSFSLYAQEDYVILEWDGTSIWYVIATNGPVVSSAQTSTTTTGTTGAWTAIGNGLTLGTLAPGVYDIELRAGLEPVAGYSVSIAIGNGTTPISDISGVTVPVGTTFVNAPAMCAVRNYVLTAAATIQGIYYSSSNSNVVLYAANYSVGKISARRIG